MAMSVWDIGERTWKKVYRRVWSAAPTSKTAETDQAWQERQFRYYATMQPYTHPLTMARGNMTGETWEMRQAYREWAIREPAAKAALLTKCLAVCQLDLQLKPADKNKPVDRECADWCKWSIQNSDGGSGGLLFNMLFPGLVDGFSLMEKVFGHVQDKGSRYAGWWTLKKAASIDTNLTRFRLDTYREVVGVQSVAGTQAAYELEPADFMIFTHLKIFENPFGNSDMRAANRACTLIEDAIRLRHILLTNYSGPFIKATTGDTGVRAKLMGVLQDARANGWIVVPTGTEIEVLDLATANLETFRSAIEDLRQEIVTAIQGAYLQLLEGGVANGRGNTDVHKGIAELFQWWLASQAAQVISKQLLPDLVIPNFGFRAGIPQLTLGGIDEAAITAALDRFKRGQDLGVKLSTEQVRDIGGFEVPRDDSDVLTPPQHGQPGGGADPNDPFGGMLGGGGDDGGGGWKPGVSPRSGESGYVSGGGAFRRNNPSDSFAHVIGGQTLAGVKGGGGGAVSTFRGHDYEAAAELLGIHPDCVPDAAG